MNFCIHLHSSSTIWSSFFYLKISQIYIIPINVKGNFWSEQRWPLFEGLYMSYATHAENRMTRNFFLDISWPHTETPPSMRNWSINIRGNTDGHFDKMKMYKDVCHTNQVGYDWNFQVKDACFISIPDHSYLARFYQFQQVLPHFTCQNVRVKIHFLNHYLYLNLFLRVQTNM